MAEKTRTTINGKFTKGLLVSVCFLILTLLFSVLADRIVGAFLKQDAAVTEGIVFPPRSAFRYQTPEFDFTADINSLGFRDREFALGKGGETRILAVGDSFTYGWGVAADESFPKLLEANLRRKGDRVQIANLGQPGGSPSGYARIVDKAVPILKPDLVIVFILQGDDLGSAGVVDEKPPVADSPPPPSLRNRIGNLGRRMYPNFIRLVSKPAPPQPLSDLWKNQAEKIAGELTADEKSRFDKIDARVKQAFINGELNPALIEIAIKRPRYFLDTYYIDKPEVQSLISAMAANLAHIKETAERYGSKVIAVPVPYKVYASRRDLESSRRLGLDLITDMAESDSADKAVESACRIANVDFFSVTTEFRKEAENNHLFYEMDGHFNRAGHKIFADLITAQMARQ